MRHAALALVLGIGAGCLVSSCQSPFWPKVEQCAPSAASLVSQVEDILLAGGDYEGALKELALKDGASFVECAVAAAVDTLVHMVGVGERNAAAIARGKAFLAKVNQ